MTVRVCPHLGKLLLQMFDYLGVLQPEKGIDLSFLTYSGDHRP